MLRVCRAIFLLVLSALVIEGGLLPVALSADRDAIWKVVHDRCVLNEQNFGKPDPCVEVHLGKGEETGFAILKDLKGTAHYLVIPTEPITGIESPDILKSSAVNWFSLAWEARGLLDQSTGRAIPRSDVALAINSVEGRGQDQLHIHVSCILPLVKSEIDDQANNIGTVWSGQTIKLDGKKYFAERVERSTLANFNPIKVIADEIPDAKYNMDRMTIIVVGASGKDSRDGFFIFAGRSDKKLGDRGKAEDLLDNNCDQTNQ